MSNFETYQPQTSAPPAPEQQAPTQAAPVPPVPRTLLVRSRNDRVIAGVCGGFADFTGFDANLIRILLVAVTVLGAGTPLIVYLAAWLLMPEGD